MVEPYFLLRFLIDSSLLSVSSSSYSLNELFFRYCETIILDDGIHSTYRIYSGVCKLYFFKYT